MVVVRVHHQRDRSAPRRDGITSRHRDVDDGRAVGHDPDRKHRFVSAHPLAVRRPHHQAIPPRRVRREPAAEAEAVHGERRRGIPVLPARRRDRDRRLAPGLNPGSRREQQRVSSRRHRLVLELEVAGVTGREGEAREERRAPHRDFNRVGASTAEGEVGVERLSQRSGCALRAAQRVEPDLGRLPRRARRPGPERHRAPPGRRDVERNRIARGDDPARGLEPERARDHRQRAPRLPEERRRTMPDPRRPQQQRRTGRRGERPAEQAAEPLPRAAQRVRGPGLHLLRGGQVRGLAEPFAGSLAGDLDEPPERACPPRLLPLQPGRERVGSEAPGGADRRRGGSDRRHRPRDPRHHHPYRGVHQARPRAPCGGGQHREQAAGGTDRAQPAEPPPERTRRPGECPLGAAPAHCPPATAYTKRFTPMRSAASCFSGGSRWTSKSSHPSPRSLW